MRLSFSPIVARSREGQAILKRAMSHLGRLGGVTIMLAASIVLLAQIFTPVRAQAPPGVREIAHGKDILASDVGPAAAGFKTLRGSFPGTQIRDGRTYPFMREISEAAHYDGFFLAGPHLLIEGVAFDGPLDIYASRPIVMRGVSVRTTKASHWAIHTRPEAGAFYFLWSEAGASRTDGAPVDRALALERALYLRANSATVYRSHISRTADGIQLHAARSLISETLIDELVYWEGDHNDGIQMLGRGSEAVILKSRIVNRNRQTSCLNLMGDRVRVEDTYLSGGGWVIYGGADGNGHKSGTARNVIVRNSIFGRTYFPKSGHFGPVAYWDKRPGTGNIWERNRFDDGNPVLP